MGGMRLTLQQLFCSEKESADDEERTDESGTDWKL